MDSKVTIPGSRWRGVFAAALMFILGATLHAQQSTVTFSEDFQSYGKSKKPAGWIDTKVGSLNAKPRGYYKTRIDPTKDKNSTSIVYGTTKSIADKMIGGTMRGGYFAVYQPKVFSAIGRFEVTGRMIRVSTRSRAGLTVLNNYPEKDKYYLIREESTGSAAPTLRLSAFGAGTPAGRLDSGISLTPGKWYRFRIATDSVAGVTNIRARFWLEGTTEPTTYAIEATDSSANRLVTGRFGVWAGGTDNDTDPDSRTPSIEANDDDDETLPPSRGTYVDDLNLKSPADTGAPTIQFYENGLLLDPTRRIDFGRNAAIEIRIADDLSTHSYVATLDNLPYRSLDPITAEGTHLLKVRATDAVGNFTDAQLSILIDKTAPAIALSESGQPLVDNAKFKRAAAIQIQVTDALSTFTSTAKLDGNLYTSGTPIAAEGPHTLLVEATDAVGNRSTKQVRIVIDLTAPVITFLESGAVVTSANAKFKVNPSIEIRVTDAQPITPTATLDGNPYTSGTPITVDGRHTIVATAVDEAGNSTTETLQLLVDKVAPVIVLRESGTVLDPANTAIFARDAAIEFTVTDATSQPTWSAKLNNADYASGAPIAQEQTHTLTVHAVDETGNVTDVTLSVLIDKTPPVVSFHEGTTKLDPRGDNLFRRDVAIRITADDANATPTVTATLDGAPYTSGTPITTEGQHVIVVRAVDTAGNVATADVELRFLIDKTNPVIALNESGTPLPSGSQLSLKRDAKVGVTVTDNFPGYEFTAKLDGSDYTPDTLITAEGTHTIAVHAVDAAGNEADASATLLIDKTGPTIRFFDGTNELLPSVPKHKFKVRPAIEIRVADEHSNKTYVAKLNGVDYTSLTPIAEGIHTLAVVATDALGNETSATLSLLVDLTQPVIVLREGANLLPASGAIFNRDIRVTPDVDDLSETTVTATLDDTPFSLSVPVAEEGPHTLKVTAVDELEWSATVTSTFTIDKTAPVVTILEGTTPLHDGKSFARDVALTASAVDITRVEYAATLDGQSYTLGTLITADGTHTIVVTGTDAAGNQSAPVTIQFHIERGNPEVVVKESGQPFPVDHSFPRDIVATIEVDTATSWTPVATIDGSPYTLGTPYGVEGANHKLKVVVTTVAGNSTTVEIEFEIDKTAPTLRLMANGAPMTNGQLFGADFTPTVEADDNLTKPPVVVVTLDGQTLAKDTVVSEEKVDHTISATATDRAGNVGTAGPLTFTLDKTDATITVTVNGEPLKRGDQFKEPITPLIDAQDLTETTIAATLDGNPYNRGTAISEDGAHTLVITATDLLGHVTTYPLPTDPPLTFVIDKTAPVVTVLESGEPFLTGSKYKRSVTPTVRVVDTTDTIVTATLDGNAYTLGLENTPGQEITSEGHHELSALVTDELGWSTPVPPIRFTIDNTPATYQIILEDGSPLITGTIFNRDIRPRIVVTDATETDVDATLDGQLYEFDTLITVEGAHTLAGTITDALGNVTPILPISFVIDKTPPVIVIKEQGELFLDGALLDHDALPVPTITDTTHVDITATMDGQQYDLGTTPVTTEGAHTLVWSARDAAGWTTPEATIRFRIDKTAPVVTITDQGVPLESKDFGRSVTPVINIIDSSSTTTVATIDGQEFRSGQEVSAEGSHTLAVTVTDAAGWPTVVPPITFYIDKTKAIVRVLENGAPLVSGTKFKRPVLPQIEINETGTTTTAKLGDAVYMPDTSIETEGTHTLYVSVTDRGGNVTDVPPITFLIDRTQPVVTITEGGRPFVSGAFKTPVTPEIAIHDITETDTVAKLNGELFTFGTQITEERRHTLSVTVTDELGWETIVPTIGFAIDMTPPIVELVADGKPLETGALFNHAISPQAIIEDVTDTETTATLNGALYVLGTPIEAEGEYTLDVRVTDEVGLSFDVPTVRFRIDTTKPVLSFITPANQQTLVAPRVLVSGNSDDSVTVDVNGVPAEVDLAAKRFTVPSLELLEGTNTIVAIGTDAAGNASDPVSVEVTVDTRAPEVTIASPAANACLTTKQVQVSGAITDPHVASVSVAILPGTTPAVTAALSADQRTWSATLQFPSEGKFVIAVTARDSSAHESVATVQVRIDETMPRIEITESGAPFVASFVNRTVAPFVRAVDADPNVKLTLTLDGAPYVSGTPIAIEKAYELKATAVDCAGNNADEVTARFTIDKTPPQFVTLSPSNGASVGSMPTVAGTVSPDTVSVSVEENGAAATVSNGSFTFPALAIEEGSNRFTLVAVDRAGNATRLDYSFNVKTTAPTVSIVENGSAIVTGTRYTRPVTVDVVSNEAAAVITATHNGQPFTSGTTISNNGSHTISATARDSFGHTSPVNEVTFTIDNEGPVVTITEPLDGATVTTDTIRVRGTVTGDPVSATINGAPLPLSGGAFDATVALEVGPNEIAVIALDAAGNSGVARVDVTRGGGTLGLILTSPVGGQPTNRRTTTVAGQVLSPAGVSFVTVNGIQVPIDAAGAFRKTDFALTEGQNVITAVVRKDGAEGSVSVTVIADFTPPAVTVRESGNALEDEARFATQANITATATDAGQNITPTILIDAAPATSPVTVTANGGHTIVVIARDAAGNETRVERTFFIGGGATGGCTLSDFDPPTGALVTADHVTLVGRTGGAAGVKVNGTAAVVSSGSFSATVNLPVEGENVITVTCTDANGNPTGQPKTLTLIRATGAPSIDITSPAHNSVTGDEVITVTGTLSGQVSQVTVNGSAATITGNTFSAPNVRLSSGVNVIVARARNSAGRTSTDSIHLTWLKNAPSITITSPATAVTVRTATVDVSGVWTGLDPASLTVTRAGTAAPVQTGVSSDTTGTFRAAAVPLSVGTQTITVRGLDRLGRAATATIDVTRAEGTPSINITDPADNTFYGSGAGATFTVSGSFDAETASTVEVNGENATLSGSTFTATVPFSALLNTPVVARVTQPDGTYAVDTIRVSKLGVAPKVLQTFPEADAVDVEPGTLPLVLFSAAMDRASVRSGFRLENAAGTAVSGDVVLDRDVLTFAPAALLAAGERLTIRIAGSVQDLAGNAMGTEFTRSFTVAATAPVNAPTLNAYATRVCGSLVLSGTAPANVRVRIDLGTLTFNTTASATGAFSFTLPLSGRSGFQVARVRVVGSDGSLSAAAEAQFEVDCAGPQVTNATYDRATNALTITFSKAINLATVTTGATGSVRLQLTDGTIVGGAVSALAVPSSISIVPAQNLGEASFTLTVTTAVQDTGGTALTAPYSRAFTIGEPTLGDGAGYISGEVFDADTGRPLPGANVSIDVPLGAFARNVGTQSAARTQDISATAAVVGIADNRGRYLRELPEGAHTIRASADNYTTVWRQIIVRTGAGVIPTDIRLTPRGVTKSGNGAALVLNHGGAPATPLALPAELRVPAGMVATGNSVTLTSVGAQSLAGLLPLGWSPLASAEIVTSAPSLSGAELEFTVPESAINSASQTLTAVRYFDDRDEWRAIAAVVPVAGGKAKVSVSGAGAYALVYPDKDPRLAKPGVPVGGSALAGVADPCLATPNPCAPIAAKEALQLVPPVVLPTQRTVATLRIEGAGTSLFPSGTAVQAYVDEELRLADGTRDVVAPFATDLLLYRNLAGDTGEAVFHLAPSARASEVVLEVGYDHIRIVPYPERLDRGALIGPEGGRVPADDRVAVEIPAGATTDALSATAVSIQDFSPYGTIPGYRIVGGLALTLQWAGEGTESSPVELFKPARATFTVTEPNLPSQLVLVEMLEGTQYGRIFRLASQITALEGGTRFSTRTIDRAVLPVDGIIREGRYLLLAPNAPIAFATGTVHMGVNGPAVADARVLTPPLGVIDLTRVTGIFNVPVPAAMFSLIPRTVATGDGAAYNHPSAPAADAVVNVGALSIVAQPPAVTLTVLAHSGNSLNEVTAEGATGVATNTSVKASFSPGVDPASVATNAIVVLDDEKGNIVPGRSVAQGSTGILWTLEPGTRLNANASYTAIVSPNVLGTNGTPVGTVSATFATVSTLSSPNVDPSKIRITMPDANGRARIIGAPGALAEHWNAVAVRRFRDFSNRPQDSADAQRSFLIELGTGTDPLNRVTIADEIYLQIINEAGSVAAIVQLGPFTTEDGRGFVAPAGKAITFTTPDNVTVAVPAEAFDVPTVVRIDPAAKAVFEDVPGFNEELSYFAGFKIDFEGVAKKRLDITFPAPANLPAGKAPLLGYHGISSLGPRIMVTNLLRADGDKLTTTLANDGSAASIRAQSVRSEAIVNPTNLRDMLMGIDRGSLIIGFTFQTSVTWITFAPPPHPPDFFVPPIKSIYYASFAAERPDLLIPVAAGGAFNVIGIDPGSGLEVFNAPYTALQPGEPNVPTEVTLPSTNEQGPYPVFTSPGRVETLEIATSEPFTDESIRNLKAEFNGSQVTFTNAASPLPANTHVEVINLRSSAVVSSDFFSSLSISAEQGDRLVVLISDKDVDPNTNVTVVFSEPIDTTGDLRDHIELWVRDPAVGSSMFQQVPRDLIRIETNSGDRRVSVIFRGGYQRGKQYRLKLLKTIKDVGVGMQLQLGQRASGSPLAAGPLLSAHLHVDFTVRAPKGFLSTFNITAGAVRDLAMVGNILFISAQEGGIFAYDASNPLMMGSAPAFAHIAAPVGSGGANWGLTADIHGRLYATAVTNMYGIVRSYRVEDMTSCGLTGSCPDPIPTVPPSPDPAKLPEIQHGNAIITWRTGVNVGMPLASMIVGGWPEAIPRKIRVITRDSEPEIHTFEDLVGAGSDAGNGFRSGQVVVSADSTPYEIQRISVVNVTRDYRWSADVKGTKTFTIFGQPSDEIHIIKNLSTVGAVALYGYGVGVYDLDAMDANFRHLFHSTWERMEDEYVLSDGQAYDAAECDRAQQATQGRSCEIGALTFAPDIAATVIGDTASILVVEQYKGLLHLTMTPGGATATFGRPGSMVFAEKLPVAGGYFGHPRINRLRTLYKAASGGRLPQPRYATVDTFKRNGKTYALVSALDYGLMVVRLDPKMKASSLVDVVWAPAGVQSVRVAQSQDYAVAVDGKGRVLIINLAGLDESSLVPQTGLSCTNVSCEWPLFPTAAAAIAGAAAGPGEVGSDDPRIVWKSPDLPGGDPLVFGTIPPIFDSETGFVYSGNVLDTKLRVTSAADPRLRFVGDSGMTPGQLQRLDQVVPLGITPGGGSVAGGGSLAAFRLEARLPGSMNESAGGAPIRIAIDSETMLGVPAAQTPEPLPPSRLRESGDRPTSNFFLRHDAPTGTPAASLRYQRGWNRMVTPWVLAVADPRATKDYSPAGTVSAAANCDSCDLPLVLDGIALNTDYFELWSAGRTIFARPDASAFPGLYSFLGENRRFEARIGTIPADLVRPSDGATDIDKIAGKNLPTDGVANEQVVAVNTGEVARSATDLKIKGRGLDLELTRYYSSAITHVGPFGRNMDSPLFARVQTLPNGDVVFYDGTGRKDLFTGGTTPPEGVFLHMRRSFDGAIVVAHPDNTLFYFDPYGRLARITDRNTTKIDGSDGNAMRFSYGANGKLAAVIDSTGRTTSIDYYTTTSSGGYEGCIRKVTDFDGRVVEYSYDSSARLTKVSGPDPASASSAMPSTVYDWETAGASGAKAQLYRSGQMKLEKDGLSRTIWSAGYNSTYPWAAQTVSSGGGTWSFALNSGDTTVVDPNSHAITYQRDEKARLATMLEPGGATTSYGYDAAGRIASVTRPLGDKVTYGYGSAVGNDRRAMANVTTITEVPEPASPEFAAGMTRVTAISYGPANQPAVITTDGATTTIVRDARGNPQSVTEPGGVTTTLEVDGRGQLRKTVDPRTGVTLYHYETADSYKKGYIKTITASDGTTNYQTDNRGNITHATLGAASVSYTVNKLDQVEKESKTSSQTLFEYDAAGSVTSKKVLTGADPSGTPLFSTSTFQIDELGHLITRIDDGRTTTYGHDPVGNVTGVAKPSMAPITYGYDARNRLISMTQNGRTAQFTHDKNGNQTSITNARGKTATIKVDGFGNPVRETEPDGVTEVRSLDQAGRPVDVRVIKQVSASETVVLRWTQFVYDDLGRLTREVKKRFVAPLPLPANGDPEGATDVVTETIYDDANRLLTTIDPLGNRAVTEFDAAGRPAKVTDAAGNVTELLYHEDGSTWDEKVIEKHPDGHTETFVTRKVRDADGRVVAVTDMNGDKQRTTTFRYDARGNEIERTDAENRSTRFEYDLRGNRIKEIDPEGGVTEYRYDDADQLVLRKDANGNETTYQYDETGNLTAEIRQDGARWTHTYDENGNVKTATDPNGTVITNTYDDLDRLIARHVSKGPNVLGPATITRTLDGLGRPIAHETDEGVKTTATYDSLDRMLTESVQIGSGPARAVTQEYDAAGNLISRTYPSGLAVTQAFNPLHRIEAIRDGGTPLVTYADAGRRLVSRVLSNGISESWTYDPSGRLRAIEDRLATDVIRATAYDRSAVGAKSVIVRSDLAKQWSYDRNDNGWITGERVESSVMPAESLLASTTYGIDKTLNYRRLERQVRTPETTTTTSAGTVVNTRNQYTSFGGAALTYDRSGNLETYAGAQLRYDFENRLKKAVLQDGTVIENTYDATGRKVAATTATAGATTATAYVVAGDQVLEEYVGGALAMRYVRGRGIDEIVRAERSSAANGVLDQVFFPLQDELGNVDRLTDSNGVTLERYEYTGLGDVRIFSPASEQTTSAYGWKWLFQGRESIRPLNAYDFRARTLWPELGRFGQEDRDDDHPNEYQALRNAWPDATDPYGLAAVFYHLYYPVGGYTPQTFYDYLTGTQYEVDTRTKKRKSKGISVGYTSRGHTAKLLTNKKTVEADLKKSLMTDGALVVYFGHTAQSGMRTKEWAAYLDPLGSEGDHIAEESLQKMLEKAKAAVTLLAGCNSVKCSVPKIGGSGVLVTVESGNETNFSNGNIIAIAISAFVKTLIPDDMLADAGSVGQAIDAANAELKQYDNAKNKFVLKKGSKKVVLK